mgnify:CR=1 FL=1
MRTKKSNEELGYNIRVQKKKNNGRYKIAFAKSINPDKNGNIRVRTNNLFTKIWSADGVEIVKNYKIINTYNC